MCALTLRVCTVPYPSHFEPANHCCNLYRNSRPLADSLHLGGFRGKLHAQSIFLKLFVCLLFACVPMIYAQTTGGTLSGTITSPSGAAVANAAVTVTNTSTNAAQRVLTAPDGTFTVSGLTPGTYKLEVESSGFKRTSQQSLDLTATGPGPINITLEPGSMSESVEIKAHAPMIQTDNNEMSVGLNMRTVQELPVIDRNHQELANLQPGITPPDVRFPLTQDPSRQREWNTNGQPYYSNHQGLEGVTNYEPMRGTAVRVVPEEAVQQFNVAIGQLSGGSGFRRRIAQSDRHPARHQWLARKLVRVSQEQSSDSPQPLRYHRRSAAADLQPVRRHSRRTDSQETGSSSSVPTKGITTGEKIRWSRQYPPPPCAPATSAGSPE